ncbi:hypothetical protein CTAYLR_000082 [Chrysophaeum taylorii]|uniref:L-glutamate gamma-semialdehyde dehydrogenase n=1 Tax=Chrysophaeum taylorii TaxID=2483200 RepID=A0AAD7UHB1_9STRA|nr:hypothetical protein CTAYLR_000082 [Chrysophaeum taylorii]
MSRRRLSSEVVAAAARSSSRSLEAVATRSPGAVLRSQTLAWQEASRRWIRESHYADERAVNLSNVRACRHSRAEEAVIVENAVRLVKACRTPEAKRRASPVQSLLHEYRLSSREGATLLSLAEAVLRVRSPEGRSRLIADKLENVEWGRMGLGKPAIVNAASAALAAGEIATRAPASDGALAALVHRIGRDAVRVAVVALMRRLGDEFVLGENIEVAMDRAARDARKVESLRHSYDMLGEAAKTAQDAEIYWEAYAEAIDAIGRRFGEGEISVKLSALDPRFEPHRLDDVGKVVGRVVELATRAADRGIDLTIDAEEAARLELQLDVVSHVSSEMARIRPSWKGLGLAVQAYQRRAPQIVDWAASTIATKSRPLRVRLVKGAYWDSEIKWAQQLGAATFPVFTRKEATDACYAACASKLLEARDLFYPAFATHSARTVATVAWLADRCENRNFEFQRLHGMGEDLHAAARDFLTDAPTRVYAPVGDHDRLLAYLVRRLLENGANSSFVHAVADDSVPAETLALDPAAVLEHKHLCSPHPEIKQPPDLFLPRQNSRGLDVSDVLALHEFAQNVDDDRVSGGEVAVYDPTTGDRAGSAPQASDQDVAAALGGAKAAQPAWDATGLEKRATILRNAADELEARRETLCGLLVADAGKTWVDGVGEIREAADFLRYYADRAEADLADRALPGPVGETNTLAYRGRGVWAAVSPFNLPLAIFVGQMAAPLVAGNAVVAKSAPQTPLVASAVIDVMRAAGVPEDVLAHLPDPRDLVGPLLVGDPRVDGVVFTGSGLAARSIARTLADRDGPIVPLIAETAGLNAIIADESALPEQLVHDAVRSAFNSAGQRCSSARLLCVPSQTKDRVLEMLAGAVAELRVGDPARVDVDCGPLIDARAKDRVAAHVDGLLSTPGVRILARANCQDDGNFYPPLLLELPDLDALPRDECFGPVLHVVAYDSTAKNALQSLIHEINNLGYGLTMGLHSRLDGARHLAIGASAAGNLYVNRDCIAAVVESQPFGGHRLSGTGPKAGGPNYVRAFAVEHVVSTNTAASGGDYDLMARIR